MSDSRYQDVGFKLKNGVEIMLCNPGVKGETNMGEHLDLIVRHPNGERAIVTVTCSGLANGDKYLELEAQYGQPLKHGEHTFHKQGASFQPINLYAVTVTEGSGIECLTKGAFRTLKLNLTK